MYRRGRLCDRFVVDFTVSDNDSFWNFLQKHSLQVFFVYGIVLYACIGRVNVPSGIFIFLIFILIIICACYYDIC